MDAELEKAKEQAMTDLVMRLQDRARAATRDGLGDRAEVQLMRDAAIEITVLRGQVHALSTGGGIPGTITRGAIDDDD